jgi:hypothetical protein
MSKFFLQSVRGRSLGMMIVNAAHFNCDRDIICGQSE